MSTPSTARSTSPLETVNGERVARPSVLLYMGFFLCFFLFFSPLSTITAAAAAAAAAVVVVVVVSAAAAAATRIFMAPHLVRAESAYRDIRTHSFHHTHTHARTHARTHTLQIHALLMMDW